MVGGTIDGTPQQTFVSWLPDDLVSAGLADDFDGEIVAAKFGPWNYNGKIDKKTGQPYPYFLTAHFDVMPVDGQEQKDMVEIRLPAGDLKKFAPSQDGVNPVDLSANTVHEGMFGPYVVATGDKKKAINSTNYAFWLTKLLEAEPKLRDAVATGKIDALVGLKAHFNRIPQPTRKGLEVSAPTGDDGDKKRSNDILVVTHVLAMPGVGGVGRVAVAKAAPAAAASAAAPAAAASTNGGGDLESRVVGAIVVAIAEAADNTVKKGDLAKLMLATITDKAERPIAISMVGKPEFLTGHASEFVYDADTMTLRFPG